MLKSLIAKIRNLFIGKTKPGAGSVGETYLDPPDADELVRQLRIKEQAQEHGKDDLPPTDARQLDGPQQRIVQFIEGEIQRNLDKHRTWSVGLNRRVDESHVENIVAEAESLPRRLRQRLDELYGNHGEAIEELRSNAERKQAEYQRFREQNELLERDPDYPESRFYVIALLVFTVLAEGVLNAYFFRLGSELGIVGGALYAFLFAAVDVSVVFSLGFIARFMWARGIVANVMGWAAALSSVTWVILYNLAVAHYRELLQGDEAWLAMDAIVGRFTSNMVGLVQGDSWLLFVVGVLFSSLALLNGLFWFDDRVPFYGKMHRRLVELQQDWYDEQSWLKIEAAQFRDEALERLATLMTKAEGTVITLQNAIGTKLTLADRLKGYIELCKGTCNALIAIYRTENQRHRDSPPPAYFQDDWTYPMPHEVRSNPESEKQKLADQETAYNRLVEQRPIIANQIEEEHNNFLRRLGVEASNSESKLELQDKV